MSTFPIEFPLPDVVVVDKRVGKWTLVDFSVHLDKNVVSKEDEITFRWHKKSEKCTRSTLRSSLL